jgi:hypothetical protein
MNVQKALEVEVERPRSMLTKFSKQASVAAHPGSPLEVSKAS